MGPGTVVFLGIVQVINLPISSPCYLYIFDCKMVYLILYFILGKRNKTDQNEFKIMKVLMGNIGKAVSGNLLMVKLWENESFNSLNKFKILSFMMEQFKK